MGNLSLKKCSLKIDPLQQSDQGPFAFRIEIASFNKFSYFNGKVSITTLSKYQVFYYDVFGFFLLIVIAFSLYLFELLISVSCGSVRDSMKNPIDSLLGILIFNFGSN